MTGKRISISHGIFLIIGVTNIIHVTMVWVLYIAIHIYHIYGREFMMNPDWSRMNGNIENYFNTSLIHHVHYFIEPYKIELSFRWFIAIPSQMAHTNNIKSGGFHELDIGFDFFGIFIIVRMVVGTDIKNLGTPNQTIYK